MLMSFYDWCIGNNRNDLLDRWDYALNKCKPNNVSFGRYYFKCPINSYHNSELKNIGCLITGKQIDIDCIQCKSIAQFLIDSYGIDGIKRYWSDKNTVNPWCISAKSHKKVWIKCNQTDYHDDYETICRGFSSNNNRCPYCWGSKTHPKDSFAQYHIDNTDPHFLEKYWDYDNNTVDPYKIRPYYADIIWIKCQYKEYHGSYYINASNFTGNKSRCPYCVSRRVHPLDSFAQWGINNTGDDFLNKYWDFEKNSGVDPWCLSIGTNKQIYIKCQNKDYHIYLTTPDLFSSGIRCGYCGNRSVHPLDSLGSLHPIVLTLWSDKNQNTPYEFSFCSSKMAWWRCPENKHNDYFRSIAVSQQCEFRCPECVRERTESFLQEKVRKYIANNYNFHLNHEYNCSIIPCNPRFKGSQGAMPFDNEIRELKLVIEVHGQQHYDANAYSGVWLGKTLLPEQQLHKRKLYDRYKKVVALANGYFYLEIPYWAENKESYKKLIDEKIADILSIRGEVA